MSSTATLAKPVETIPDRTHTFKGGPFNGARITLPGPTLLDHRHVNTLVWPRGVDLYTGLVWRDVEATNSDFPTPSCQGYATYRRVDDNAWEYVPTALKAQTGHR
jgi:hypothetical protein